MWRTIKFWILSIDKSRLTVSYIYNFNSRHLKYNSAVGWSRIRTTPLAIEMWKKKLFGDINPLNITSSQLFIYFFYGSRNYYDWKTFCREKRSLTRLKIKMFKRNKSKYLNLIERKENPKFFLKMNNFPWPTGRHPFLFPWWSRDFLERYHRWISSTLLRFEPSWATLSPPYCQNNL